MPESSQKSSGCIPQIKKHRKNQTSGIRPLLDKKSIRPPLTENELHRVDGPMPESSQKSSGCIPQIKKHRKKQKKVYTHYSSPAPKKSESHRTSRRWVYTPAARPPSPQPSTLSSPLPAGPTDPVQHISRPPACLVPAAWETIQTVGRCTSIRRATGHSILELWNWKLVCIQIESYVSEIVCATTLEIISIFTYFGNVFSDSVPLGKKIC